MHPSRRASSLLLATLTVAACGDDSGLSTSLSGTSSTGGTSTGDTTGTPTTDAPTTSTSSTTTSGGTMGADGSSTSADVTSTGPDATTSTTTDVTTASTGDTTTSSTGDTTTSSTGDTTTTSSTGDDTTSTSSSGDGSSSTTMAEMFNCDAPPLPDLSQPPQIAGCDQVDETLWCLTLTSGAVTAIGLDSQTTCQVTALQTPDIEVFAVGSLGVVGPDLFTCTSEFDGVVARVSLGTGAVELAPTPCTAVTTWRGRVLVQDQIGSDPVLDLYASWADVVAAQPLWSFSAPGLFSETLTTQADVLYAAWHSDDHVDRFDLPCGEPLGPITLDGFDDWMQGIGVSDDQRLLTFGFSYDGLRSFDAGTGAALPSFVGVDLNAVGLACFAK